MEPIRTKIYGAELRAQLDLPVALLIAPFHEAMANHVSVQCEKDGLRAVVWGELGSPPPLGGKTPIILIAELPPGERRIPDHIVSLMNHTFSDVPLLLLCSDILHRPAISLQGGRVTLVGPPPTAGRVSSRLRALLAGKFASKRKALLSHDHVNAKWWVGGFGVKPSAALVRQHVTEGVTVLLPSPGANLGEEELRATVAILRKPGSSPDDQGKSITNLLANRGALLHLSSAADAWSVYWPESAGQLEIVSSQRLPAQWNLSAGFRRSGVRWARLGATGGDIMTAVNREYSTDHGAPGAFAEASSDGGPAVVDYLDAQFANASDLPSGAVVEVR